MVKFQPSKLAMRVRFPLPAPRCSSSAKPVDLFLPEVVERENPIKENPVRGIMKENRSFRKLACLVVAAISAGVFSSLPVSNALAATPADMIQSGLPPTMTLRSAPRRDFLSAVCNAVSRYRRSAPQIVRSAIETRPEFSRDIVNTAIGCLREPKEGLLDCDLARQILLEAIAANPRAANDMLELMISLVPDCQLDIPGEGPPNVPVNINPPPGPPIGPGPSNCVICHNGHEIHVLCDNIDSYLSRHPGDTRGGCQSTPVTNP
jgi:hypothetical protein